MESTPSQRSNVENIKKTLSISFLYYQYEVVEKKSM